MKTTIICTYLFLLLILAWVIYAATRSGKPIARKLRLQAIFAAFAVTSNIIFVGTENLTIAGVAYGVYYSCIDWMLLFFLLYTVEYTGNRIHHKRILQAIIVILLLDSASLISNFCFGHMYQVYSVQMPSGEMLCQSQHLLPFGIHLAICYTLVFLSFVTLLGKMWHTPRLYWIRYVLILGCFMMLVAMNVIFMLTGEIVDRSIVTYAVMAGLLAFFTFVYEPKVLIDKMLSAVVTGISDGILFFDIDGNCIYANDNALRLFDLTDDSLEECKAKLQNWTGLEALPVDNTTFVVSGQKDDSTLHLRFEFHNLYRGSKLMGYFYRVQDRTEEVERIEHEKYIATHDRLTNLMNRETFYAQAEMLLREHPEDTYDMVAVDIRDFKLINDVFGTRIGDEVLIDLAGHIRAAAGEEALCGRINNDKFGVFLRKEVFYPQLFEAEIHKLKYLDKNSQYPIFAHVGVYEVTETSLSPANMFSRALIAIQEIKRSFREVVSYYDEFMRQRMLWEQKLSGDMELAMERGEFCIYLQPQVDKNKTLRGAEALVRWNHPTEGFLKPERFLQVFERNGMIAKLDVYVWEEACKLLSRWQSEGKIGLTLSINISPKDFFYMDIPEVITGLVKKYDLNPRVLNLEITESVMMTDIDRKMQIIQKLHEEGFRVEMDDFGSGYSSLNMLKDLPVDVIKTDMAFLRKGNDAERARQILKLIISMARQLHMSVITEGIANEEQFSYLSEVGSDLFQGNYVSRAISIEQFEENMKTWNYML